VIIQEWIYKSNWFYNTIISAVKTLFFCGFKQRKRKFQQQFGQVKYNHFLPFHVHLCKTPTNISTLISCYCRSNDKCPKEFGKRPHHHLHIPRSGKCVCQLHELSRYSRPLQQVNNVQRTHAWVRYNRPANVPQNCPFRWGIWTPHLKHGSFDPNESAPQTESRSVRPFLNRSPVCQKHRQTDRQTNKHTYGPLYV